MDLLELGCACLELPYLKPFMDGVGLLGRGVTAPAIGLSLIAFGYCTHRPTFKRTGWAVLIALAMTAALVNLLKISLQMPRPTPRSGYGFPSGDSGTAFSLATVVGIAFPSLAPPMFLLATLTSISRLYFRAHYVTDILGGAAVGIVCGKVVTSRMLPGRNCMWLSSWTSRFIWGATGVLTIGTAIFFLLLEAKIAEHRRPEAILSIVTSVSPQVIIDFGTPAAQPYLLKGWSRNQLWHDPSLTINWVEGSDASLAVSLNADHDLRLRFRAYPYRPKGFLCQRIDVSVAGRRLGQIYLEQDWNAYEMALPKNLAGTAANKIDLHFPYADTFNWHGVNPDHKPLSVAFDLMEAAADGTH